MKTHSNIIATLTAAVFGLAGIITTEAASFVSEARLAQMKASSDLKAMDRQNKQAAYTGALQLAVMGMQNFDGYGCRTPTQTTLDPQAVDNARAALFQHASAPTQARWLFDNIVASGDVPPNPAKSLYALRAMEQADLGKDGAVLSPPPIGPHHEWVAGVPSRHPEYPTCADYESVARH